MHESSKIRREISRLYDRDPQGWAVLLGRDPAGFFDVVFSHGKQSWQIKEYQVNPYKFVGIGSKIRGTTLPPLGGAPHQFGLRPVGVSEMKELATLIDEPTALNELASKLLGRKTVSSSEAFESPAILQGPVMQSTSPIDALSTAHSRLDEKLRKELRRIVNREFRHTLTPYG